MIANERIHTNNAEYIIEKYIILIYLFKKKYLITKNSKFMTQNNLQTSIKLAQTDLL